MGIYINVSIDLNTLDNSTFVADDFFSAQHTLSTFEENTLFSSTIGWLGKAAVLKPLKGYIVYLKNGLQMNITGPPITSQTISIEPNTVSNVAVYKNINLTSFTGVTFSADDYFQARDTFTEDEQNSIFTISKGWLGLDNQLYTGKGYVFQSKLGFNFTF